MDDGRVVDWALATFDGLRRQQRAEFASLPLRDKIRILEEMQELADAMVLGVRKPPGSG
jgi:hypothetical protein